MSTGGRLADGGRIDRAQPLGFTFDGQPYTGYRGDTLASALLANGVGAVSRSVTYGRPRGIATDGVAEPNAFVQLDGDAPEPMLPATAVELRDGLAATGLGGRGRLGTAAHDPATYDRMNAHCDVLVVGAGPAGLAAALAAGRSGARVILADERSEPGGTLLGTRDLLEGAPATDWVAAVTAELADLPDVTMLPRTTVAGYYDHNFLLALQRRTDHLDAPPREVSRQRLWHIRARRVVLATGAHERPLVFADNDRPGVMLANAARTYVNRYAVAPGRRAVVFTTCDSAYAAALDLAEAGVEIAAVLDARGDPPGEWVRRCALRGIPVLAGHHVVGTTGGYRLTSVQVAPTEATGPGDASAGETSIGCDLLLVSGGWDPAVHLFSQSGGGLAVDEEAGAFVPARGGDDYPAQQGRQVTGAAGGTWTLGGCLRGGAAAGAEAAIVAGFAAEPVDVPHPYDDPPPAPPAVLWCVPHPGDGEPWTAHFVDLARDATVADIHRAAAAGLHSVELVKRFTTIGTGPDQGKTSGTLAAGIIGETLGTSLAEVGTTTFRPPYTPVPFAAMAGRDVGALFDPARLTAIHPWHVAHGAVFEDVGQWKRP